MTIPEKTAAPPQRPFGRRGTRCATSGVFEGAGCGEIQLAMESHNVGVGKLRTVTLNSGNLAAAISAESFRWQVARRPVSYSL